MSGSITGGNVQFLKRVKTGDYEHAEAIATINFSVDDGTEHVSIIAEARTQAVAIVYEALGLKVPGVATVRGATLTEAQQGQTVQVEHTNGAGDQGKDAYVAKAGTGTKGKGKTKPPTPPEAGKTAAEDFDPLAGDGKPSGSAGKETPSAASGDEGFDPLAGAGSTGGSAGSAEIDDASLMGEVEDEFASLPEEITDARLLGDITAKNAETKNTNAIRKLIGKYTPQDGKPHAAKEIPTDMRQAFLIELGNVQTAA